MQHITNEENADVLLMVGLKKEVYKKKAHNNAILIKQFLSMLENWDTTNIVLHQFLQGNFNDTNAQMILDYKTQTEYFSTRYDELMKKLTDHK